jgi:hypothetical protein
VADLAASHGKPMSIPEWGVTIRDDGHGGGDEPRYITAIADFIADPANNVAYEAYFNFSEAGNEHDLWDDDSFPLSSAQYLEDFPISGVPDVTPPVATVTSGPTLPKISSQTGKNATDFTFTVSEAYEAYELRVVDDDSTSRLSGALIESGGSGDGTARTVEVTFSELNAASAGNGSKVVKVFVQDSAGNWSA